MINLGNILIIGDSYSAATGTVPAGYGIWYEERNFEKTDVRRTDEAWWRVLLASGEASGEVVRNESWSGTTVSTTERPTLVGTSFVKRLDDLIEAGFFSENRIDTVFVLGGTNDSWIDSPVGEVRLGGVSREECASVLPAFSYLLSRLGKAAPEAKIITVVNCDIKDEIRLGMEAIAVHYGAAAVMLDGVDKMNGHPSVKGMREIAEQVINALGE